MVPTIILSGEVLIVGVCYNKLFKLLIDKNMKKGDLCEAASVSPSSMAKLKNGENVNTDILVRICRVLQCEPGDIMEMSHDENHLSLQKVR
jgi:DNA-binding Xre family transcriptional regulator